MKLEWTPFDCGEDETIRMKDVVIGVDMADGNDAGVTLIVSQSEDVGWLWTYHLEFDAIVEPGEHVNDEQEAKVRAHREAIAWTRRLLEKLEASVP